MKKAYSLSTSTSATRGKADGVMGAFVSPSARKWNYMGSGGHFGELPSEKLNLYREPGIDPRGGKEKEGKMSEYP